MSPNGQPAFYEYRNSDPLSPLYGAVDKPTFLWAGGWFIRVSYALAGVRDNAWNLSFSPRLPEAFSDVEYEMTLGGELMQISFTGDGEFFRRIVVDGVESPTAVMTGPAGLVQLRRGIPRHPYLAAARAIVREVTYDDARRLLSTSLAGAIGQEFDVEIVTPLGLKSTSFTGADIVSPVSVEIAPPEIRTIRISGRFQASEADVLVWFGVE
jgi:hypothetical protein